MARLTHSYPSPFLPCFIATTKTCIDALWTLLNQVQPGTLHVVSDMAARQLLAHLWLARDRTLTRWVVEQIEQMPISQARRQHRWLLKEANDLLLLLHRSPGKAEESSPLVDAARQVLAAYLGLNYGGGDNSATQRSEIKLSSFPIQQPGGYAAACLPLGSRKRSIAFLPAPASLSKEGRDLFKLVEHLQASLKRQALRGSTVTFYANDIVEDVRQILPHLVAFLTLGDPLDAFRPRHADMTIVAHICNCESLLRLGPCRAQLAKHLTIAQIAYDALPNGASGSSASVPEAIAATI